MNMWQLQYLYEQPVLSSHRSYSKYLLIQFRFTHAVFELIEDIAMQYLPWFFFGCNTHKGLNDFFSQKLFKPQRPFFYTSKYGT